MFARGQVRRSVRRIEPRLRTGSKQQRLGKPLVLQIAKQVLIRPQPNYGFHEDRDAARVASQLVQSARRFRWALESETWRREAAAQHNNKTARYLLGMPLLGDYLEEGLSMVGRDCEDVDLQHL